MKEVIFKFQLFKFEGFIMANYSNRSTIHMSQDSFSIVIIFWEVSKYFSSLPWKLFYPLHFLLSLVYLCFSIFVRQGSDVFTMRHWNTSLKSLQNFGSWTIKPQCKPQWQSQEIYKSIYNISLAVKPQSLWM